jgi:hypothetical protein
MAETGTWPLKGALRAKDRRVRVALTCDLAVILRPAGAASAGQARRIAWLDRCPPNRARPSTTGEGKDRAGQAGPACRCVLSSM